MYNRRQLIESNVPPIDKNVIWLKNNTFRRWTGGTWESILTDKNLYYDSIINKPKINGIVIEGNVTSEALNIESNAFHKLSFKLPRTNTFTLNAYSINEIIEAVNKGKVLSENGNVIYTKKTTDLLQLSRLVENNKLEYWNIEKNGRGTYTINTPILQGSKDDSEDVKSYYSLYNSINNTNNELSIVRSIAENALTLEEVTYDKLYELRYKGMLIPGRKYRITDYSTKVAYGNDYSTADHAFDIIVTALSEDTLSEEASAIQNKEDSYFYNSNLEAWKIWYCIDNDSNRFDWANNSYGKGVIYRMIDEFGNDLPYDFKNIKFKRTLGVTFQVNSANTEEADKAWSKNRVLNGIPVGWLVMRGTTKQMDDKDATMVITNDPTTSFFNTFYTSNGDASITGRVKNVKIFPTYNVDNNCQVLNNNIFIVEDGEVYNIKLGYYNYNNTFRAVKNITFGNSCAENIVGDCSNVSFGDECYLNIIYGNSIKLGNNCSYNSLDSNVVLKERCSYNSLLYNAFVSLGNGCEMVSPNKNSSYYLFATVGDYCKRIEGDIPNKVVINPYTTDLIY